MVRSLRSSSSRLPLGVTTVATSPTFLPSSARPIGEVVEINPLATSDSSLVTSWYLISAGHQLVLDLFVLAGIEDGHGRAEPGLIGWDVDEVDHGKLAHPLLELPQPGVYEHLPLLGHVVFGVFTKVAQCDGLLDLCGKLGRQFVLQQLNLFCEPFHYLFWHGAFRN